MSNVMPDGVFEMMWDEGGEHRARHCAECGVGRIVRRDVNRGAWRSTKCGSEHNSGRSVGRVVNVGLNVVSDAASDFAVNAADTL
ncbi:hypothetical protein KQI74_19195 [Paenibacillus barcinonensis]|jgi:hypothetical protein|uniref:hypothetical protein n=1 Tax=Paenibacillus barcinonensis TaxID=198119 RepID=UPI001C0FB3D6|nr:hypothetical protein [Paenibacillus barcinonensis]MBU5354420.1 hypothetical protein [Paenibacillus barcinonensis]